MKKQILILLGGLMLGALPMAAQNYSVTFTVDLGTTITPSGDGIHIAGDFQSEAGFPADWEPGTTALTNEQGTNKYSVTVQIPAGTYNYKFINGNNWGEGRDESVPSECNVSGNRVIDVSSATTVQFCFGSCLNDCPAVVNYYTLTLNVDMRFNCKFNVDGPDSVDFAGPYNGWAGGNYLTDDDNDGIYSITLQDVPEGEFKYKARIIKNLAPDWESGGDKILNITENTTAAVRCFGADTEGECAPIPAPGDVTFRVDLTDEVPASVIYLIADFTTPPWQPGALRLLPVSGMPGVYEITVEDICPRTFAFKFVNGDSSNVANEETITDISCTADNGIGGKNRVFTRPSADAQLIYYKYNTCTDLSTGIEPLEPPLARMLPNPAQNNTSLIFHAAAESYTVSLTDMVGKNILMQPGVRGNYTIERGNLPSGIYFVSVTNDKGQRSVQKLIFN